MACVSGPARRDVFKPQVSRRAAMAVQSSPATSADMHAVLKDVFGIDKFRGCQENIVRAALAGVDAVVLMATGGGKSLCYQLPAVLQPGVPVVVCPLVALMDDQLLGLRQRGIACAKYDGTVSEEARHAILASLSDPVKILYTSPEQLHQSNRLRDRLIQLAASKQLQRMVFDEAHCMSRTDTSRRCMVGKDKRHHANCDAWLEEFLTE